MTSLQRTRIAAFLLGGALLSACADDAEPAADAGRDDVADAGADTDAADTADEDTGAADAREDAVEDADTGVDLGDVDADDTADDADAADGDAGDTPWVFPDTPADCVSCTPIVARRTDTAGQAEVSWRASDVCDDGCLSRATWTLDGGFADEAALGATGDAFLRDGALGGAPLGAPVVWSSSDSVAWVEGASDGARADFCRFHADIDGDALQDLMCARGEEFRYHLSVQHWPGGEAGRADTRPIPPLVTPVGIVARADGRNRVLLVNGEADLVTDIVLREDLRIPDAAVDSMRIDRPEVATQYRRALTLDRGDRRSLVIERAECDDACSVRWIEVSWEPVDAFVLRSHADIRSIARVDGAALQGAWPATVGGNSAIIASIDGQLFVVEGDDAVDAGVAAGGGLAAVDVDGDGTSEVFILRDGEVSAYTIDETGLTPISGD